MKKVLAAAIMFAFVTFAQAQTAAPAATATAAAAPKKEKKVKAPKADATATAPAAAATTAPAAAPAKVKKAAKVAATPANDDVVKGTDDKGRTIYEGPKGGQYYINSNGNKSYLKADKKM